MDDDNVKDATEAFEKALRDREKKKEAKFVLKLFVSGMTPRSMRAIENTKKICEEHLKGRYQLEVVDLYQHPEMGKKERLIAAPTLIKKLPEPLKKFIGDLSDTEKILVGLELAPKKKEEPE